MEMSSFSLQNVSRASIAKIAKRLNLRALVIPRAATDRIYSENLYGASDESNFEERSFISSPVFMPAVDPQKSVMLFTPSPYSQWPVLTNGRRAEMFAFRGIWNLSEDPTYVGTRKDWEMMPALFQENITRLYGGLDRINRVDLRESYLSRYVLKRTLLSSPPKDVDFWDGYIDIGEEQAQDPDYVDSSEGMTGSSL
ncbi:hypothetical protein GYMLUDRAFT_85529 [Collybiopsis luxurians FD-317 M1]|uniref:Uncharacterized protein n=1 Tax=Collybiopsis luxurians FD-317 M1 TaxID=944289 RepID=A0A0D0CNC3_9AGAR|nr:hypothetical protein GYMLUDRAFT_85529 [Collybiopsis luxurians FD-317 M1]